jgi:predicted transcriptional regulator
MAKPPPMEVVPFRLPPSLVRRLDAHAARLRREQPGVRFTRADAARSLLEAGLAAAEGKGGRHGKA